MLKAVHDDLYCFLSPFAVLFIVWAPFLARCRIMRFCNGGKMFPLLSCFVIYVVTILVMLYLHLYKMFV